MSEVQAKVIFELALKRLLGGGFIVIANNGYSVISPIDEPISNSYTLARVKPDVTKDE